MSETDSIHGLGVGGPTDGRARRRPHCVYKHYDEDDVLLYVGCCLDITSRTYQHAGVAKWTLYAAWTEGRWYPNFEAGRAAEAEAIRTERPIFNVKGYPLDHVPNEAGRDAIRERYLRDHGYRKPPFPPSGAPLTGQGVAAWLRQRIIDGTYTAGDNTPPVRDIARSRGVGIAIAREAMHILRDEGLVVQARPKGPFRICTRLPA